MRNLRPALLAMLLAAAGLGVPGCFAQSANAKSSAKKKAPANSTGSKRSSRASSAKSSPVPKSATPSSGSAKTPHSASHGTASHSATKKSASKRSRRQPGQKAPTTDRVSEIQAALAKDGSFAGIPTGKWDDSTTEAMRKFQASHRLNPTGKLDAPTLQKLGLGSQTAGVAAPTPPPGAVSRLASSNSFSSSSESSRQP